MHVLSISSSTIAMAMTMSEIGIPTKSPVSGGCRLLGMIVGDDARMPPKGDGDVRRG